MDELTFCRRAKALVRECVRGWYEKTMGLPTLMKVVDTDRFSWIGCNEAEYLPGKNKEEKEDRMEHMQDIPERLYFGKEQYYFQPLTPTACLIFARYELRTGEKYGDIAETLQIAPSTVRYYVTELCRKFHVKNRAQLVVAAERELLPEDGGGGVTHHGLQTGFRAGFFVPFFGSGILTIPSYPS